MTPPYVFASLSVASTLAWFAYEAIRKPHDLDNLRQRLDLDRAERLYRFMPPRPTRPDLDDDALWREIGGARGLYQMFIDAGVITTLVSRIRETEPDCAKSAESIWWNAVYLRASLLLCLGEAGVRSFFPIPRMMARSAAYLYCDIAASLEVVLSSCDEMEPVPGS